MGRRVRWSVGRVRRWVRVWDRESRREAVQASVEVVVRGGCNEVSAAGSLVQIRACWSLLCSPLPTLPCR